MINISDLDHHDLNQPTLHTTSSSSSVSIT